VSLGSIRTQIKTTLEGVSGIGQVYEYLRHVANENMFKTLFIKSNKLNAWLITREAVQDNAISTAPSYIRTHNFKIFGFYGLKDTDATENTFQALVDTVLDDLRIALEPPSVLSGAALNATLPQARAINHKQYSKRLTHACEITFTVDEYIPPV
jgi:hypothetical protein